MLNQIYIRNFAIIDTLELDIQSGMTVMTGETGAGKSILVGALGLVLGDRADSDAVRHGTARAEICAYFDTDKLSNVQKWLQAHDLDHGNECVLRRIISVEGRSRGYINGSPAPLQQMKELGEMLVDIHGQHQHQSLLKPDIQRQSLDDYAGNKTLTEQLSRIYQQWQESKKQLDTLRQNAREKDARLELLRFHTQELEALGLQEKELDSLDVEHRRLANSGQLMTQCNQALQTIFESDEGSALDLINQQLQLLESLRQLDGQLGNVCTLFNEACIQIQEGSNELRHYIDRLELDPERLSWIDQRLATIHDLARKHHCEPQQLPERLKQFSTELAQLENVDIELDALEQQLKKFEQQYSEVANKLTQKRNKAAAKLAKEVSRIIQELGMPAGKFSVELNKRETQTPHRHGQETISFLVAANPGQPAKALSKVASGGELSRISLAIQTLLSNSQKIPTLIFDEVDTGIGGAVAETVGQQLRNLGKQHQVLCVTHLAQVATCGHHHLLVNKETNKNSTKTQIKKLSNDECQEEIARMLGGAHITDQSRAHAQEMIERMASIS